MKKIYALFLILVLGSMLAACSASTANISSAELGTGFDSSTGKATGVTATFDKGSPEIHYVSQVSNAPDGTAVKAVLTAVDVTDASGNVSKDRKVTEDSKTLSSDAPVDFKFSVPSEWPVGTYKIELYLNDKLDRTANFTVQ